METKLIWIRVQVKDTCTHVWQLTERNPSGSCKKWFWKFCAQSGGAQHCSFWFCLNWAPTFRRASGLGLCWKQADRMVLCFSVSTVLPLFDRPLPGPGALPPDLLEPGFEMPRREGDFLPSSWPELTPFNTQACKSWQKLLFLLFLHKATALVTLVQIDKRKSQSFWSLGFHNPKFQFSAYWPVKMVGLGFLRGSWRLQYSTRENHLLLLPSFLPNSRITSHCGRTSNKASRRTSKKTSWRTSRS